MSWIPTKILLPKKFLGIDIGTSWIKMVEVSKMGKRRKLENYGFISPSVLYEKKFRTSEKSSLVLSSKDISRAILAIKDEAKIKATKAIFSIPDFSSFFTTFELPPMSKDELSQAVEYEARQHIPMPLKEVALDWQVIEGGVSDSEKTNLKVLLVAVPKEVINQYKEIAKLSKLELYALEAEVFSLMRALVDKETKEPVVIIDIGAQSTTCNIVDKRQLKVSHSFDMSGNELTKAISQSFSIDYKEAEEMKKKYGILETGDNQDGKREDIRKILIPLVDVILSETERIINNYSTEKEIKKVILAGGLALLPGLKEHFAENLKKEVEIANPFSNVLYPPILERKLREIGPSFAIAMGVALRGLEY